MNKEDFSKPQRQSDIGILIIFMRMIYNFIRGTWPIFLIVLANRPSFLTIFYLLLGGFILLMLGVVYSVFYYKNFLYHIDFDARKFILQKGVFSTNITEVPFEKIQQVDIKRSILQRLIGVYSLTIDTAGSKKDEVAIRALSEKKARTIAELLVAAKKETQTYSEKTTAESAEYEHKERTATTVDETIWTHKLSLWQLIKIGLTKGYLRGMLLTLAFISTIYDYLEKYFDFYLNKVYEYSEEYLESTTNDWLSALLTIISIILIGMIVTITSIVIKYFGLNVKQSHTHLQVEMGLKTNSRVSFQPKRLQHLTITTNPVQRRLNLYEAKMSLAGSIDDLDKSKIDIPGLSRILLAKIQNFLYQNSLNKNARFYKPHKAWPNRHYLFIFLFVVFYWCIEIFALENELWPYSLYITLGILALLLPWQYFHYKTIKISVSEEFLIIKSGIWSQKKGIVELYKLQGFTARQPLWYRKRGLYNLTFHTAGGDFRMRALPAQFLRELNYTLYKIESTKKAWM